MPNVEELSKAYSGLSKNRLASLLHQKEELSLEAQQVLSEEISKRELGSGINIEAKPNDNFVMENQYNQATLIQRFLNSILDFLAFFLICFIFFIFGYSLVTNGLLNSTINNLISYVTVFGFPLLNYIYLEGKYGKTIGKFITKTTVIKQNGEKITFKDAFLRTLYRLIPLEFITIFLDDGLTFHDKLSKTFVAQD